MAPRTDPGHARIATHTSLLASLALLGCAPAAPHVPGSEDVADGVLLCAGYVDAFQVPQCDVPLTPEEQARRWSSYRLTRRGGRTVLLEHINGVGQLITTDGGRGSWELAYQAGSAVPTTITERDVRGEISRVTTVSNGGRRVDFKDADGHPNPDKNTKITAKTFVLDDRGYELEARFWNVRGAPAADEDGSYGGKYVRNARGFTVTASFVDASGAPSRNALGCTTRTNRYDARGFFVGWRSLDAGGAPCRNEEGIAGGDVEVDDVGNRRKTIYVGSGGARQLSKEGVAGHAYEIDGHGCVVKGTFFDVTGSPALAKEGIAGSIATCDARGNRLTESYFDTRGKPTVRADGVASVESAYDERNLEVRRTTLGLDGKPFIPSVGYASLRRKFDAHGRWVELRYFGVLGEPVYSKERYATIIRTVDERGRELERRYRGAHDEPVLSRDGHAMVRTTYDAAGNAVETRYFDAKDAPMTRTRGFARRVRTYDDLSDLTSEAFLDDKGNPTLGVQLVNARTVASFDDRGMRTDTKFYGLAQDKPTVTERYTYDAWGRVLATEIFGPDGQPAPTARIVSTYDEAGRKTSTSRFGPDGRLRVGPDLASVRKTRYDELGNPIWERTFGADGRLVLVYGTAGFDAVYDVFGRVTENVTIGIDGEPFAGPNAAPRTKTQYDVWGHEIAVSSFDAKGQPLALKDGIASSRFSYDARGDKLTFTAFGADGWPVRLTNHAYHAWRKEYDLRGREITKTFLDENGKPAAPLLVDHTDYDERSFLTARYFTSPSGQLTASSEGCAIIRYENDDRGRPIKESCLDVSDRPAESRTKMAFRTFAYERADEPIEVACFALDGTPADNAEGWSVMHAELGPDGRLTNKSYRSKAGAVVNPDPSKSK